MSQNVSFIDRMDAGVANLNANADFNQVTNHITYDASKVELPENVTVESINTHINLFNELTGMTETATAAYAREQRKTNENLTVVDATLNLGNFVVTSQHNLQQQVGDEYLYGLSVTTVDYIHSAEQTDWLDKQREANRTLAAEMFK